MGGQADPDNPPDKWSNMAGSNCLEAARQGPAPPSQPATCQSERARPLQAALRPGTSVKRVAGPVSKWIDSRHTGQSAWTFHDTELYEHEINPLQRFLVDSSISGGKLLAEAVHPF